MSLLPPKLSRYRAVAALLMKYGRTAKATVSESLTAIDPAEHAAAADATGEELAADLEKLGPTFIKLGQVLATRADLLPPSYLDALARLQDDVSPFPFEDVQQIIETELGVRLSKAFSQFDEVPTGRRRSDKCIARRCVTAGSWP